MDELIAFLRARLDDRETVAKAAASPSLHDTSWVAVSHLDDDTIVVDSACDLVAVAKPERSYGKAVAHHIMLNDPAHVLADIAGKRAIVDMAEEAGEHGYDLPEGVHDGRDQDERECDAAMQAVLAEVLHHHPGYNRRDWGPLSSGNPLP